MQKRVPAFLESFRRITSAGNYIPEIDGLRFVSIFWVVFLLHALNMVNQKLFSGRIIADRYWLSVFTEGGYGVSLFMIISGFILSLPFIKEKLYEGKKVSLKKYYLRRLTRLEPPYLAALTIAFILLVFFVNKYSLSDLLPHYGASAVYMHNIIYEKNSLVLGIAWSLEIEVQFYLIAPFLSLIFLWKNDPWRRLTLVIVILLTAIYAYQKFWTIPVILPNFICYFLAGMLLADLYCKPLSLKIPETIGFICGLLIMLGLPFLISIHSIYLFMIKLLLIFLFFFLVLFNKRLKKVMSIQWVTIIGGMCYSIYLLHFMIMSGVTRLLQEFALERNIFIFSLCIIAVLIVVLAISAIFYKLIEQPCMRIRPVPGDRKSESP